MSGFFEIDDVVHLHHHLFGNIIRSDGYVHHKAMVKVDPWQHDRVFTDAGAVVSSPLPRSDFR